MKIARITAVLPLIVAFVACGDPGPGSTSTSATGSSTSGGGVTGPGTEDGIPISCSSFEDCLSGALCRDYKCTDGTCQFYAPSDSSRTCGGTSCQGFADGGAPADTCQSSACVDSHCDIPTGTCVANASPTAPPWCWN